MKFSIIAAADEKMGIGIGNKLPWRLKGDLKYFSDVTTTAAPGKINAVIMGRKTWESLPAKARPLRDRLNIVLSRGGHELNEGEPNWVLKANSYTKDGANISASLYEALDELEMMSEVDKVFVIGGASLYVQAIAHPDCEKIYLTEVKGEFRCDAFFPYIPDSILKKISESKEQEEGGIKYRFVVYRRAN
jgi:dihydrofolate reductase